MLEYSYFKYWNTNLLWIPTANHWYWGKNNTVKIGRLTNLKYLFLRRWNGGMEANKCKQICIRMRISLYIYPNMTMSTPKVLQHFYTQITSQCHYHVLIKYTVFSKTSQPLPLLNYQIGLKCKSNFCQNCRYRDIKQNKEHKEYRKTDLSPAQMLINTINSWREFYRENTE